MHLPCPPPRSHKSHTERTTAYGRTHLGPSDRRPQCRTSCESLVYESDRKRGDKLEVRWHQTNSPHRNILNELSFNGEDGRHLAVPQLMRSYAPTTAARRSMALATKIKAPSDRKTVVVLLVVPCLCNTLRSVSVSLLQLLLLEV